jgi:hypothetical protein
VKWTTIDEVSTSCSSSLTLTHATAVVFRAFRLLIHLNSPDALRVVSLMIQGLLFTFQVLTTSRLVLGRATGANVLLAGQDNKTTPPQESSRTGAITTTRLVIEIWMSRYDRKGKRKKKQRGKCLI